MEVLRHRPGPVEFASIWGCLGPSPTSADERQTPSEVEEKAHMKHTESSAGGPNGTGGRTRCPGSVTYLLYDTSSIDSIA